NKKEKIDLNKNVYSGLPSLVDRGRNMVYHLLKYFLPVPNKHALQHAHPGVRSNLPKIALVALNTSSVNCINELRILYEFTNSKNQKQALQHAHLVCEAIFRKLHW